MKINKYLVAFLLIVLSISKSHSQFSPEEQLYIDSLNSIVNDENYHDTFRANAYLNLSEILYTSNLDTMIPLCQEANKIIEKALQKKPKDNVKKSLLNTKAGTLNNIAFIKMNKGEVDTALAYLIESLHQMELVGDKEGIATGLNNVGYVYNNLGKVEKAIEYYHKSLKLEEEVGNKDGIATSLNNLGFIYKSQGDFNAALEYYNKALKIFEEIKNLKRVAGCLSNIGSIYEKNLKLDTALIYFNNSLQLRIQVEDIEGIASVFNNIGSIMIQQGKIDSCISYLLEALEIRYKIEDKDGISVTLVGLAEAYYKKNDIVNAKKYAERSLVLSKELGYPKNIQKSAKILSTIYEKEQGATPALEMYKLFVQMKDSIQNDETLKASNKQQAKYDYEKQKVLDDAENEKRVVLEIEEKKKQKIVIYAAIIVIILVLVFLILLSKRLRITREQKILIEEANEELNQTNEEILAQRDEIERQKDLADKQNTDILSSISYAKRIQVAILPSVDKIKQHLPNSFFLYKPKDIVSGDFYWMEVIGEKVFWAAVDCTGHGVPGAFMSIVGANGLKKIVVDNLIQKPSEILEKLTDHVIESVADSKDGRDIMDGMDIALCCWDKSINLLEYAGAYNPMYLIRNNELIITKATKRPIGRYMSKKEKHFENHQFQLEKDDCIFIFSDGYADQFGGESGSKFTYKRFQEILIKNHHLEFSELEIILNEGFEKWKGKEKQLDDVCVIGVKI